MVIIRARQQCESQYSSKYETLARTHIRHARPNDRLIKPGNTLFPRTQRTIVRSKLPENTWAALEARANTAPTWPRRTCVHSVTAPEAVLRMSNTRMVWSQDPEQRNSDGGAGGEITAAAGGIAVSADTQSWWPSSEPTLTGCPSEAASLQTPM